MGSIIQFNHKACGFKFDYFEGVGFSLFAKQCHSRQYMRNGKWGEKWKKLIEEYPNGTATLNRMLCYCEQCKKYYHEPRIEFYIPKDGYYYEFGEEDDDFIDETTLYKRFQLLESEIMLCPDCKKEALVMEDIRRIKCPVCEGMIKGRDVGIWD